MHKIILNLSSNRFFQNFMITVFIFFVLFLHQGCFFYPEPPTIPILNYKVMESFPHDPEAFTQGLVWEKGFLYEGTGLYGSSSLRKVELTTGKVLRQHVLPANLFGEGITAFGGKIYQLTWKAKTGFIYNQENFQLLETFSYPYEGWGITHDGKHLIISDGTSTLHFIDPETLQEVKKVVVTENGTPIEYINELEYIQGNLYANIWQTDQIAIIQVESGQVAGWLDLSDILKPEDITQKVDVLNGIAYHIEDDCLLVTGKFWPKIFKIKILNY